MVKELKFVVGGIATLLVLTGVVINSQQSSELVDDFPDWDNPQAAQNQEIITEHTILRITSLCPVCDLDLDVPAATLYSQWYGLSRSQLIDKLASHVPPWTLVSFRSDQVIVHATPEKCPDCKDLWPSSGYIGIHSGKLAIFNIDRVLVEVLEISPPGDWYQELLTGIKYDSIDECEQLLQNISS